MRSGVRKSGTGLCPVSKALVMPPAPACCAPGPVPLYRDATGVDSTGTDWQRGEPGAHFIREGEIPRMAAPGAVPLARP